MSLPYHKKYGPETEVERLKAKLECRSKMMAEMHRGLLKLYVETHRQEIHDFLDKISRCQAMRDTYVKTYRNERLRLHGMLRRGEISPQQNQQLLRPMTLQRKKLDAEVRLCEMDFMTGLFLAYNLHTYASELSDMYNSIFGPN